MSKQKYFSTLDKKSLSLLSSKAGKRAWKLGVAHRFTKEEARAASIKGVEARRRNYEKNNTD